MLRIASSFVNVPIASLHAGFRIGRLQRPIINPNRLNIEAFICEGERLDVNACLLAKDVREVAADGVLIDHQEDIVPLADLIRLQDIVKINFQLIDKKVYTESNSKLSIGKVSDFVIDDRDFLIMKLYVKRPAWRAIASNQLVVARNQIVKVTDSRVVVKDAVVKVSDERKVPSPQPIPAN